MNNQDAYSINPPLCRNYADRFLVFDRGEGCHLYDIKGNRYLDMAAGIAVNALGYGRKDIAEIMSRQAEKIIHCSNLFSTIPTLTLAQKLTAASGYEAVFFGNSGTEANEAALKFARIYAKARKGEKAVAYLSFESAFHGRTAGTLSVTPNEKYQKSYRPLLPECYTAVFNDIASLEAALNDSFAAVIVEPVQGEGGHCPDSRRNSGRPRTDRISVCIGSLRFESRYYHIGKTDCGRSSARGNSCPKENQRCHPPRRPRFDIRRESGLLRRGQSHDRHTSES